MKIEVGKSYITRGGVKVKNIKQHHLMTFPFCGFVNGRRYSWDDRGRQRTTEQTELDLVKEWTDEGLKHDSGKPIAGIMFEDFPNALSGVCEVATFGANKYKRNSWKTVSEAHQRYSDALARHLLAKGKGEVNDPESGLSHSYHIAWNALAIAELEALNAS